MLPFYAGHFKALELNFTYYRMPSAFTLERMVQKTAGKVTFSIKANQEITHTRSADKDTLAKFKAALVPMTESSTLGCVLAQFPWSFHCSTPSLAYLQFLSDQMIGLPVVVEFRNARWIKPEIFDFLKERRLGFCCVDQPRLKGLIPPVAEATSGIGYVRFHGRNAASWWKHEKAYERYDYLYSREELQEWIPKIRALEEKTDKTFLFTNNHYEAKAVANARMLAEMLEDG